MDPTGTIVLVTGGASGIGRATVLAFARVGAAVAVLDLRAEAAESVAREAGGASVAVRCDVSDERSVDDAVAEVLARFGRVDVCVNNAGIDLPTARSVTETSLEDWDRTLEVNVTGTFLVSRAVIPAMEERGSGVIINVASVAALAGMPEEAAYGASKGAVVALTRQMAVDLAPRIRVNAVAPGLVAEPTLDRAAALGSEDRLRRNSWAGAQPMGRAAAHEEVASVILFLAGEGSSYMTGTTVVVDGGMTAR